MPEIPDPSACAYTALRAVIAAAWPETMANGIWEADHVDMFAWENLQPPYAVIAIQEMPAAEWGGTNDVFQPAVEIYYIAEVRGPHSELRERLNALRRTLNNWDQEQLQVVRVTSLSWSADMDPNPFFVAKNMLHRAGRLTVEILVGESLNLPDDEEP